MSPFIPWLNEKIDAARAAVAQVPPELKAEAAAREWEDLSRAQGRLAGRHTGMVWGAIIDDRHLPELVAQLGARLDQTVSDFAHLAQQRVLELCGVADAPRGLLTRLGDLFKKPTPPATVDQVAAGRVLRSGPWKLYAPLLDHRSPIVRRVVVCDLDAGGRGAIEQLVGHEADVEVIRHGIQRLGAIGNAGSAPVLRRLYDLTPPDHALRPDLVIANFTVAPEQADTLFDTPHLVDQLALLAAVGRGLGTRDGRERLVRRGLAHARPAVQEAAIEAAGKQGLVALLELIVPLARSATPPLQTAAIAALATLGAAQPGGVITPLLALASAPGAQAASDALFSLLTSARFEVSQLAQLVEAAPRLHDARLAPRIRELEARARPDVEPLDSGDTDLERELEHHPFDTARWLVYADQLQAHGDVRGELIARAHAAQPILELVQQHAATTLGPLVELPGVDLDTLLGDFEWHMGFIRGATLHQSGETSTMAQLVAATLRAPLCRFLTSLKLGLTAENADENDYAPVLDVLARAPRARGLRHLTLGQFRYPDEAELSWPSWGDLSTLWASLPAIAELHLRGACGDLGTISAPRLCALTIETAFLEHTVWQQVCDAQLPALETLVLWTGDPRYDADDVDPEQVTQLLTRDFAKLRHLGLVNSWMGAAALAQLPTLPLLKQLVVLDLSRGTLTDEDVEPLLRNASAFSHLQRIDLSENLLDESVDELTRALPNALLSDQRPDEGDGERYVAVQE